MTGVILVVASYLVGAIPFGIVIGRLFGGGDIRTKGSGNIGATNVLRSVGPAAGAVTFLLDFFKGTAMVLLARHIAGWDIAVVVAVAAVLGHNFPIYLRFKGGRGVAVGAGVFLGLEPLGVACVLAIFALVVLTTRIASLASLTASGAFPLIAWYLGAPRSVIISAVIVVALIFIRHAANIGRLLRGKEPRIGIRGRAASSEREEVGR